MSMNTALPAAAANEPEIRALDSAELETVTGGRVNCYPIYGEDGEMYSPTLDRIFEPLPTGLPLGRPII